MATVVVQQGHYPRTSGATGTHREQEFARALGRRLTPALRELGHRVHLIGADDPIPPAEVFVSLHTDGAADPARRGASVGYPDADGKRLAAAWKRAHTAHGYPGGWLPDNYTANLRAYYGFRRSTARFRFLAEHGTTTNPADEAWLFANLDACTRAHVEAIGAVVGHPKEDALTPHQEKLLTDLHAWMSGVGKELPATLAALSARLAALEAAVAALPGGDEAMRAAAKAGAEDALRLLRLRADVP